MQDLTYFRDEDLLALARNPSANVRPDAIRHLVERGSGLAGHPDIVDEAAALIHNNPKILKRLKPAVNYGGALPGVIDVLCRTHERQSDVETKAMQIEAATHKQAEDLVATNQRQAALTSKAEVLADDLSRTQDRQAKLAVQIESTAQKQAQDLVAASNQLHADIGATDAYVKDLEHRYELTRVAFQELAERFDQTIKMYEERFSLVERSPARKLYDWVILPVGVALSGFFYHAVTWARGLF